MASPGCLPRSGSRHRVSKTPCSMFRRGFTVLRTGGVCGCSRLQGKPVDGQLFGSVRASGVALSPAASLSLARIGPDVSSGRRYVGRTWFCFHSSRNTRACRQNLLKGVPCLTSNFRKAARNAACTRQASDGSRTCGRRFRPCTFCRSLCADMSQIKQAMTIKLFTASCTASQH